jgi:hypothetical protein
MNWLYGKYINLIATRLPLFKKQKENLFRFRCVECGDSEKNKYKARAYFIEEDRTVFYYCHNCGYSSEFFNWLREYDNSLYKQYLLDKLGNSDVREVKTTRPKKIIHTSLDDLTRIIDLPETHRARSYLENRKLPRNKIEELYFCEKFREWTNTQSPDKFNKDALKKEESRIIIPFYDRNKNFFAYQGRSLLSEKDRTIRYITIMLDEEKPKIYGLDKVDFNYTYYAVEGPFDSMFLDNALASAGGKIINELQKAKCNLDNAVVVYDNEPRNKEVCDNIYKAIRSNFKVAIWPNYIKEKDINLMILNGYEKDKIQQILKENTFRNIEAEIKFNQWKKC